MQYTILIHESDEGFAARTDPRQQENYWGGTMRYLKALKDAGVFVGGAGLQPPSMATTLRFEQGKHLVQDGPYADTKEQLGGLFIVNVPDLDTALEWAARFPQRPGLVIEVRPNLPND
ncbi:YciI family protein [Hylemonella gracilis]|uniref:YCII-related protein n=1 Tax=Hylemonella gracilis ATCC 19624 TaxID=887062 RepID=F3KNM2_9BURK|nr:YciI family protein [Hylemonella gracilis]EGI78588.1 YCII-related protein [Hylemonella gracilis ATCC 19624]